MGPEAALAAAAPARGTAVVPGHDARPERAPVFTQFVAKIHSRCNLSCPHCYIYEARDSSWAAQPRVMPDAVIDALADRMAEHAAGHRLAQVRLMLHGGEPLLAGSRAITRLTEAVRSALAGTGTAVEVVMQTNGTLLDRERLDLLSRLGVRVGVSLDGDAAGHDSRRRYASGRGSHADVTRGLGLLAGPRYRHLYSGLLYTVDLGDDPLTAYEALLSQRPPMVDLLLPHGTWEFPPPGLPSRHAPYARWLGAVFDRWYDSPRREMPVRIFDALIDVCLGGGSSTELWGPLGSDVVVIQPDGSVEQNDILKVVAADAAATGCHVLSHSFDEAAAHPGFAAERAGTAGLAQVCRECPVGEVCGGGLRAHRWRPGTGFHNPSCYCADLRALVEHVQRRLLESVTDLTRIAEKAVTRSEQATILRLPDDRE